MCATRLFPTADCPERNSLRLHAEGFGHKRVIGAFEVQMLRPFDLLEVEDLYVLRCPKASVGGGKPFSGGLVCREQTRSAHGWFKRSLEKGFPPLMRKRSH
jgi:hypothetical protein